MPASKRGVTVWVCANCKGPIPADRPRSEYCSKTCSAYVWRMNNPGKVRAAWQRSAAKRLAVREGKVCYNCEKDISERHPNARYCVDCGAGANKAKRRRMADPERAREISKKNYERHAEQYARKARERRASDPEKHKEQGRIKRREKGIKERRIGVDLENLKNWYKNYWRINRKRLAEKHRIYVNNNREKIQAVMAELHRKRSASLNILIENGIIKHQCLWCGASLQGRTLNTYFCAWRCHYNYKRSGGANVGKIAGRAYIVRRESYKFLKEKIDGTSPNSDTEDRINDQPGAGSGLHSELTKGKPGRDSG